MDIPDPISFLNRFGTNQRSVVQVMSRQSMPKNHVFHKNHKVPFSNMQFLTLFKTNQNMPISSLFFEINQYISISTSSLLNSHIDTLPQFIKITISSFYPTSPKWLKLKHIDISYTLPHTNSQQHKFQ